MTWTTNNFSICTVQSNIEHIYVIMDKQCWQTPISENSKQFATVTKYECLHTSSIQSTSIFILPQYEVRVSSYSLNTKFEYLHTPSKRKYTYPHTPSIQSMSIFILPRYEVLVSSYSLKTKYKYLHTPSIRSSYEYLHTSSIRRTSIFILPQ